MMLSARVSKIKFHEEVERLENQAILLRKRGVVVTKAEYPYIEVIFLPRINLQYHFPLQFTSEASLPPLPEGMALPPDGRLEMILDIHNLSAKPFGVRIGLDDFDQRAPSVVFCDPLTWEDLPHDKVPPANILGDDKTVVNVMVLGHPDTKRPFICMRGIREYHEHPQHTGDDWMLYRKYVGLFYTVDALWKACVLNATPHLFSSTPPVLKWAISATGAI